MEKKIRAKQESEDDAVRMRTNLSIPLLPEKSEDRKLAALLTYQAPECEYYFNSWHDSPFFTEELFHPVNQPHHSCIITDGAMKLFYRIEQQLFLASGWSTCLFCEEKVEYKKNF